MCVIYKKCAKYKMANKFQVVGVVRLVQYACHKTTIQTIKIIEKRHILSSAFCPRTCNSLF